MSHQIHEGDIQVARTLLLAQRPEAQIVAALVYRGVEQPAAEQAVELLKKGKEPAVMPRTTAQPKQRMPLDQPGVGWKDELLSLKSLPPSISPVPQHPTSGSVTTFPVKFGTAFGVDQFGFVGSGTLRLEGEEVTLSGQKHWSALARTGIFLGITVVPYLLLRVGVGLLLALVVIHYFCASYDVCRFEKSSITSVRRSKRKISFHAPDDAGKPRRSLFLAQDVDAASRIEQLLSRSPRAKTLAA